MRKRKRKKRKRKKKKLIYTLLAVGDMETLNLTTKEREFFADEITIVEALKSFNIQGFLIIEYSGLPILIRDYDSVGFLNIENHELLTSFVKAIDSYVESISGFLTDLGFGATRILFKRDKMKNLYCLFVSEIINRRMCGEHVTILAELSLKTLIKKFEKYYMENMSQTVLINRMKMKEFRPEVDYMLLETIIKLKKILNF